MDIRLPRLCVTAAAAHELLTDIPSDSGETKATILARALAHVSDSFVKSFLQGLKERGFNTLVLRGAPRELTRLVAQYSQAQVMHYELVDVAKG